MNSFFTLYKELLPTLDGYLMENGVPVLTRFEKVFDYLAIQERSSCAIVPSALDEISRDVLESNPEEAGLARVLFSRSGGMHSSPSDPIRMSQLSLPHARRSGWRLLRAPCSVLN